MEEDPEAVEPKQYYMDTLGSRALTRCFIFTLVFAIMIFLPAWTLAYWQGWCLFATMALGSFGSTIYFWKKDPALLARRLKSGPASEKEPRQKLIQSISGSLVLPLYAGAALDYHFHGPVVPAGLVIGANLAVLAGFWFMVLALRENSFASSIIEVAQEQRVITTGPYAYVRHPMYSGGLILFIFNPLALSSWWALIPAALIILAMAWRLLDEERFLRMKLAGYEAYCQRTRYRLIPGVW